MGFGPIEETSNESSENSKYTKGVYIEKAEIIKAENMPTQDWQDCNVFFRTNDLTKKGNDGNPFNYAFYLQGTHAKDKGGFSGWGQIGEVKNNPSRNIATFLTTIGCDLTAYQAINEDGSLSDELLADILGRKVAMIRYESSGKYSKAVHTWKFGNPKEQNIDQTLRDYFDVQLGKGNPKDYAYHNRSNVQSKKLNNLMDQVSPVENSMKLEDMSFLD